MLHIHMNKLLNLEKIINQIFKLGHASLKNSFLSVNYKVD